MTDDTIFPTTADDSAGKLIELTKYAWAWENEKSAVEMAEELKAGRGQ